MAIDYNAYYNGEFEEIIRGKWKHLGDTFDQVYNNLSGGSSEYAQRFKEYVDSIYEEATKGVDEGLFEEKFGTADRLGIARAYLGGEVKMAAGEIAAQQPDNTDVYLRALAQDRISQQLRRSNSLSAFNSAQRPRFLTGGL